MKKFALLLAVLMTVMAFIGVPAMAEEENPVMHTVTFRTADGSRNMVKPDDRSPYYKTYSEIVMEYEDGYVLQESDVPAIPPIEPGDMVYYDLEWDVNPAGVTVDRDMTFTANVIVTGRSFIVLFFDYDGEQVGWFYYTPQGDCIDPPEMEDKGDMVFIGWDSDGYLDVQDSLTITAIRKPRGDMNLNDEIDAGDATIVLRTVIGDYDSDAEYFVHLADMNRNGRIDSGDASLILHKCLEK